MCIVRWSLRSANGVAGASQLAVSTALSTLTAKWRLIGLYSAPKIDGASSIVTNPMARLETTWRVFECIATSKNAFTRGTSNTVNRVSIVIAWFHGNSSD